MFSRAKRKRMVKGVVVGWWGGGGGGGVASTYYQAKYFVLKCSLEFILNLLSEYRE